MSVGDEQLGISNIAVREGELMRFSWLESKAASILFLFSAVVVLSLFLVACVFSIPGVLQFMNSSWARNPPGILFVTLVALWILSLPVIFFGMLAFCATRDHSIGRKLFWFALFLGTGPIGSTVYYFAVYRGYVNKKGATGTLAD